MKQAQFVTPDGVTWITNGIHAKPIGTEEYRGALGNLGLIEGDPIPARFDFLADLIVLRPGEPLPGPVPDAAAVLRGATDAQLTAELARRLAEA